MKKSTTKGKGIKTIKEKTMTTAFALVNKFEHLQWAVSHHNHKVITTPAIFQTRKEVMAYVKNYHVSEKLDDNIILPVKITIIKKG